MPDLSAHIPRPHLEHRRHHGPPKVADQLPTGSPVDRFNSWLAIRITALVGTMWCAYLFAGIACISLPDAIRGGRAATVTWIAQTFLQLVLLSIIIVGQNIQAAAADERAQATYEDADAVLHTALEIQRHMQDQDREIARILEELAVLRGQS